MDFMESNWVFMFCSRWGVKISWWVHDAFMGGGHNEIMKNKRSNRPTAAAAHQKENNMFTKTNSLRILDAQVKEDPALIT